MAERVESQSNAISLFIMEFLFDDIDAGEERHLGEEIKHVPVIQSNTAMRGGATD